MREKLECVLVTLLATFVVALFSSCKKQQDDAADGAGKTPETDHASGHPTWQPSAGSDTRERLAVEDSEVRDGLVYKAGEDTPFTGVLQSDHSDGEPKTQVPLIDGKPDGKLKIWDEDGTKRVQAEYVDGKPSRISRWDADGSALAEDIVKDGGDPFSQVVAVVGGGGGGQPEFDPVPPDSPGIDPDNPKSPLSDPDPGTTTFEGEPPPKLPEVYITDIQTRGGRAFLAEDRTPFTGRAVADFDDGTRRERDYWNGLPHGSWRTFHGNGEKRAEEHYVRGTKDGSYTIWFENGQPRYQTSFSDGREVGVSTHWNENGDVTGSWQHTADGKRINLLEAGTGEPAGDGNE